MSAKDPELRRATVRAWYAKTKHLSAARRREQRNLRKREISGWYAELKSQLVCSRCGEDHPACIQFHHLDPAKKEASVADAVRKGWGRARILREMASCEVLCANCHAKLHAQRAEL